MSNESSPQRTLPKGVRPITVVAILVVLLVAAGGSTTVFSVDQTEESVILRFGQYNRTMGPGLRWKLPFGIEDNYNVPTQQVQTMNFGFRTAQAGESGRRTVYSDQRFPEESVMLTGDLNIVDVEWIIQYRINDPRQWLFNVEEREQTIRDISQSVINQLVGDRTIFDVIGSERARIETEGQIQMNDFFNEYGLGIRVTQVRLQNIVPPVGRVQDAFEDVNRAVQDMNRLINEGREEYNREIPRVRGEAERSVEEARGYRARRINEATGDTDRFLEVLSAYSEDPERTRRRLYIETMEAIFRNHDNLTLIDRTLENVLPILNIPGAAGAIQGTR